jgi:serine/threonine protein kinase
MSFPPYFTKLGKTQLMHNILGGKLKFYDTQLSDEAVDLIKKLLERDINKRLGSGLMDSAEIKQHPFYKGINFDAIYNKQFIPPSKLITPIVRHNKINEKVPMEEWYCYKDLNNQKGIKEENNEGNSNEEDTVDRSHSGHNGNESEDEHKENFVEGWDFKGVFKDKEEKVIC